MKYKFTYEFKWDDGFVEVRDYIATDDADYERAIRVAHENPEKYKIITAKRIEEDKMKLTLREAIEVLDSGSYGFRISVLGSEEIYNFETANDISDELMNRYIHRLVPRCSEKAPFYGAFNKVTLY